MSKQKQSKNQVCVLRNVGIILVLVVALSLLVGVVSATTRTVDDSGGADFARIKDAINASNPGDTIEVRSGTYYENVDVDKQLILTGIDTGTGKPVVDAGESGSVITISAGGCVVNGFNVTGSGSNWGEAGIKIRSGDNEIVNNTCSHNINGMFFEEPNGGHSSANNNTVTNNTVCHNNENGIYVYRSHYNIITSNTVNSNIDDGIKLGHATHNIISNNVANSNKDAGIDLSRSFYNIFINNTANSNYDCGIDLYKSLNNTFVGNSVSGNEDGIGLSGSNLNTFVNNTVDSNTDGGFYLDQLSNNNTLVNNNISSNNDDGIDMDDSFYNIITTNTILNNYDGIYLDHSSNNTVANNSVSLNRGNGIGLEDSANNNIIFNNTISSNKDTGVFIELSKSNKIYHNNFINNDDQAYDDSENSWDNGYPSGGNYWSDHTCYGNPSSGSQPYYIDTYGVDHYPFQDPNGWLTPTPTPIELKITDYAPRTPVYDDAAATRTFNVTVNQLVNVSWQINGTEVQLNESVTEATYTNQSAAEGTWTVSAVVSNANGTAIQTWLWHVRKNQPPLASFSYSPANPVINQPITFNATDSTDPDGNITNYEWDFGDSGNTTNTTEPTINHAYASIGTFTVTLTVTDDDGATNATSRAITVSEGLVFDTGTGTYPSIAGTHTGTITPNVTIEVSKLYTYPCDGTGGHTEYAKIYNESWSIETSPWESYKGDWHNISFPDSFKLSANVEYNYTIITGSYPQIHHNTALHTTNGWMNCTEFMDANGKIYDDWIPAIRLK